jgi:methylenetetrahydrofolate reductase (NADPH)
MLHVFQNDILDQKRFVITMELVPGKEPAGRSVDTIKAMANCCGAGGLVEIHRSDIA